MTPSFQYNIISYCGNVASVVLVKFTTSREKKISFLVMLNNLGELVKFNF
jgi:hypothetical protein